MKNRQRQTNRRRDRQTCMHTLYPNKFMKNTIVGSENVWVRKAPVSERSWVRKQPSNFEFFADSTLQSFPL